MSGLSAAERESLAELVELCGTLLVGRWAEVMADDTEPPDDWQTAAAFEAVDLFSPAAVEVLNRARAEALEAAAVTLLAFDCLDDVVPSGVDVPDDYERGIHDAAAIVRTRAAP